MEWLQGRKIITKKADLKYEIKNTLGKRGCKDVNIKPAKTKHSKIDQVNIYLKPSAQLSKVVHAINCVYDYAEHKLKPTVVRLFIEDDHNVTKCLQFPIATTGIQKGKPIYPYYEPAGRPIYIAPDYPKKGTPNVREIVAHYSTVHDAYKILRGVGTILHKSAHPNVLIQVRKNNNNATEYTSDVDLLYITRNKIGKKDVFYIVPAEVTTDLSKIDYKIRGWKYVIDTFEKLAHNDNAELKIMPTIVYISKGNNKHILNNNPIHSMLENIFDKHNFDRYNIIQLESASFSKNKKRRGNAEMKQVEYIAKTLRTTADSIPWQYHTDITYHVLENRENLPKLGEMHCEMQALSTLWKNQHKYPLNLLHKLTSEYINMLSANTDRALLKALESVANTCKLYFEKTEEKSKYAVWANILSKIKNVVSAAYPKI
ncbi:MAG TPA: hypothetical protein EYH14_00045 [Euryarchaeota archaeon]|nr:hypothetical protein [Euryarchaeota archaeon]